MMFEKSHKQNWEHSDITEIFTTSENISDNTI